MPPVFGYAMILLTYVMAGAVGLAVCLVLAIFPPLRTGARRTAGGIIGSFPGVFLFQILTLPFLALVLFVLWCVLQVFGHLDGIAQEIWIAVIMTLTLGVSVATSILGFVMGWGIGARVATGIPVQDALKSSRILKWVAARTPILGKWLLAQLGV